jgi:hypothetical protein
MLGVMSRGEQGGGLLMLDVARNMGRYMSRWGIVSEGRGRKAPDVGCCK